MGQHDAVRINVPIITDDSESSRIAASYCTSSNPNINTTFIEEFINTHGGNFLYGNIKRIIDNVDYEPD